MKVFFSCSSTLISINHSRLTWFGFITQRQRYFVGQQQTSQIERNSSRQVLQLVSLCKGVAGRTVVLLVGTVGCFVLQELNLN